MATLEFKTQSGSYSISQGLTLSIVWFIAELSKPTVTITSNITKTKGQSVEISCNVTGNPQPEVTWFRNGEKIKRNEIESLDCKQLKSGFYKVKGEEVVQDGVWRSRLFVCSATHLNHNGEYTCKAKNIMGNSTAATYLNILGE